MKENNKKWIFLGIGLLLVTIISCLIINKFPNKNLEIEGEQHKATITSGQTIKVKLFEPTDTTSYAPANKTLKQLFTVGSSNPIVLSNGKKTDTNKYWIFKASDGSYIYCIELGVSAQLSSHQYSDKKVSSSSNYWKGLNAFKQEAISLVTVYGFPNKTRSGYTSDIQFLAAQVLIWEFQQGWRTNYDSVPSGRTLYDRFVTKNTKLKEVYDSLLADLKNHTKVSSFAKSKEIDASTNTLVYNTSTKKYEVTLTDNNGILTNSTVNCPSGFTCTANSNKLTVSTSSASGAKTVTLTKKLPNGISQPMLFIDQSSDVQRMVVGKASVDKVNGYVKFSTETLGNITIKKTSEDGAKEGFSFNVTGPNNYNQTFKTNAEGIITLTNLKLGTYKIVETNIPDRYESNDSQNVTLTNSSNSITKAFYNTLKNTSSVQVLKTDKETGEPLVGAQLVIKKGLLDIVDSWTTDGNPHTITKTLDINQTYDLCEIKAPDGYKAVDTCESFKLTSKNQKLVLKFENEKTKFTVNKTDENGKPLQGAHLQILDSSNNVVDDWTTDQTGKHSIEGLIYGKIYKIVEVSAPLGYVKVSEKKFIPSAVNISETIKNKKNQISLGKTDADKNKLIGGAQLKLLDENGEVVASWISENGKRKVFEGLPAGNYTLVEEVSPDGYIKSEDLSFSVNETKNKITVDMPNDPTEVVFSKISATSGEEIGGAHLQVIDSAGKVIEEWVSVEGETHVIVGKLKDGETYTLKETIAPDGYVVSESISFTVGFDNTVVMENKLTEVKIFKKDTVSEKNVVGAHLQLLDPDGNIVREWDTTDNEYIINGLLVGVEYTLKETKAPENYLEASEMTFTLSSTEKSKDIIMLDTPIVYVDDTAADASLIAVIAGVVLVLGGVGTVIWMKKKKA